MSHFPVNDVIQKLDLSEILLLVLGVIVFGTPMLVLFGYPDDPCGVHSIHLDLKTDSATGRCWNPFETSESWFCSNPHALFLSWCILVPCLYYNRGMQPFFPRSDQDSEKHACHCSGSGSVSWTDSQGGLPAEKETGINLMAQAFGKFAQ